MRESLKIALGIFLGVLAVALCAACAFAIATFGGLSFIGSLLPTEPAAIPDQIEPLPSSTPLTGHLTRCDDLGLSLTAFRTSTACPGGYGQPAPGAKFLVLDLSATNFTREPIELPSIAFRIGPYEPGLGSTGDCLYDEQSFGNSCWQWSGRLFPGVTCAGWELFEVPLSFDEATATLNASFQDYETGLSCEAQWPLVPPQ